MSKPKGQVITGDCLDVLPTLATSCADLVFADPPFNIGYKYDVYHDRRPKADYLAWTDRWLAEAARVLARHGSLWVHVGEEIVAEHKVRLDALGLTWRNTIIWHYTFGPHQKNKFGRDHSCILHYVRHPKRFTFNADAIRVPSARQTKYGDKRANPKGRVPGDVWAFPRVCGTFKERNKAGHGCQMPEAVLERIIQVASNPGDVVLDPFAGTGTTLAVAKKLGRRFLGVELSPDYADGVRKRLDAIASGSEPQSLCIQGDRNA
jgi:site-specific DNA-methyltransferase (adenine-specific)